MLVVLVLGAARYIHAQGVQYRQQVLWHLFEIIHCYPNCWLLVQRLYFRESICNICRPVCFASTIIPFSCTT